jgi:hypothetical protein
MFPVPFVDKSFDEQGVLLNAGLEKRAANFVHELMWCIHAREKMEKV